jgi:uncharacterized protein
MDILHLFTQNLLSPAILFFILGVGAGLLKSDLSVPDSISRYLSLYLMMAIGFKGGVAIANTPEINGEVIGAIAAGIGFGFLSPFIGYFLLKTTTKLDRKTAAAVAAHYGSISIVTFATAVSFLQIEAIAYAGYIVAVVALMEAPAILSGLFIAHREAPETTANADQINPRLTREIFTNGSIMLLTGAFIIGALTGQEGSDKVKAFLLDPFQGVLCLFLLDMGLLVARQFHHVRNFTFPQVAFCFYWPLISAVIGILLARIIGLDVGTGTLFAVLCASASYIAVPAAMRLALPQVSPAIYLPMSLAMTFPFNVVVGIPLYYMMAQKFLT